MTKPADNIYWVFGWGTTPQENMPRVVYLMILMVLFPLLVYLPTHLILVRLLARK